MYKKIILNNSVKEIAESKIALVVILNKHSFESHFSLLKKEENKWVELIGQTFCVTGKNGSGKTKEGDNKSPEGIYRIKSVFSHYEKPQWSLNIDWKKTVKGDIWVDDCDSIDYNKYIRVPDGKNPNDIYKSFEDLTIPLYKYAIVYDYNKERVPGLGSALFIHLWKNENTPTAGCVAMSEKNLIEVIKNLDISLNPILVQGAKEFLEMVF